VKRIMTYQWTLNGRLKTENCIFYRADQSRLISHFFKELLTEPGESKRFYIDLMAMTQGFDQAMSVLGLELWANMLVDLKMQTHFCNTPA